VVGVPEHNNDLRGVIRGEKFIDKLSNYKTPNKESVPRI
jgi:hypothetical protein